jgi:hypothetical protein
MSEHRSSRAIAPRSVNTVCPARLAVGDAVSDGCHLQWPQGARFVPVGVRLSQPGLPHLKNNVSLPREMAVAQAKNDRALTGNDPGALVCGVVPPAA